MNDLRRYDIRAIVLLTTVAFLLRLLSPIMPDFLSQPFHWPPVRIMGLGHPFQNPDGYIFDEVYFAKDACKDLVGLDYLDPEPPLSKLVIAGGIVLGGTWLHYDREAHVSADKRCEVQGTLAGFGTWGWRLSPLIFGTLLVPLMYVLALRIWRDRFFATTAAVLMGFDGMSFVQSRIAMIDVVAIFLLLLTYLTFLNHRAARTNGAFYRTGLLLGLMLGVSTAAKWVTLAAWGTFLVFLAGGWLLRHFSVTVGGWTWGGTDDGEPRPGPVRQGWRAAFYLLNFVAIPAVVYFLSYARYVTIGHDVPGFPHRDPAMTLRQVAGVWLPNRVDLGGWLRMLFEHDRWTYIYHSTLTATHTYGSPWFSWPLLLRPVAYYYQDNLGCAFTSTVQSAGCVALRAEVFNLGNPAIWWAAIPALIYCGYVAVRERHFGVALIVLAFLAGWLPFARVTRVLFLYHMFGSLTFMMLAVAFALTRLRRHFALHLELGSMRLPALTGRHLSYAYIGAVLATFVYFYPLWTALPLTGDNWNQRIWLQLPDVKISWI